MAPSSTETAKVCPFTPADPTPPNTALPTLERVRQLFIGLDRQVPLLGGGRHVYVNLDNAATTPPFAAVLEHINQFIPWYSSVHRGTGFKSLFSTRAFDLCRETATRFVGADPARHAAIFCGNATDAINRLCRRFPLAPDELFLTTVIEHHSNLLPWRFQGRVDYVKAKRPCGMIDIEHLKAKLEEHGGKVRLVAVTGASNVTGLVPPLREIARLAHEFGAFLLVDASQLIAHRRIEMGGPDDPERIDFLAFSAHKMYAPFGTGVLIGPRDFFQQGRPAVAGGGAVQLVTLGDVEWADVPDKEEAGTPNLVGICALAKAMQTLDALGMENIVAHEQKLTQLAMARLERIEGLRIYGGCNLVNATERVSVIPIQADKYNHALLAAVLGYEWGIGVRNGCFCAQPYVAHLLEVSDVQRQRQMADRRAGVRDVLPGFVRISLGLYNTPQEIEYLAGALESILTQGPRSEYRFDTQTETYAPVGFSYDFDSMFR